MYTKRANYEDNELTKEYIHIEDVARGRWADAECSDCGEVLTAV